MTKKEDVQKVFEQAKSKWNHPAEFVFICAGMAKPGFFIEQELSDFDKGINLNYLGAVYTAHSAAHQMVSEHVQGRIIFVSSTLGLMGMIGYSQYAPTKYAIRGLAECLRQEFQLYDIKVHVYFVATIETPGYAEENKTKPEITKAIEGSDTSDKTPKSRAISLLDGIKKDQFMITSDWATDLFRANALGSSQCNFWPKDLFLLFLGWLIIPLWRMYSDYLVRKEKKTA